MYLDNTNKAEGSLYTDDGVSLKYQTNEDFALTTFTFDGGLTSKRAAGFNYAYPNTQTIDTLAIYGLTEEPNSVLQNGAQVPSFIFKNGALLVAMPSGIAPDQVNIEIDYNWARQKSFMYQA